MGPEPNSRHKFISVVIPGYNEEKYLPNCLASLKEQDYPKERFEVIVVDNNSTDKTGKIAESYGARLVGLQTHQGVSPARQAGSQAAKGEIIAGTDADTIVSKNWLSTINKYFQDPQVVAITGGAQFYSTGLINNILAGVFPLLVRLQFFFGKPGLNGFNFAIKKTIFDKIGGFDISLKSAEDVDLGIRVAKEGEVLFAPDLKAATSARRIERSRLGFFWHHIKNIMRFMIFKKDPEGFENIR